MPEAAGSAATPPQPDAVLLAAVDTARNALIETTPPSTVGELTGHTVEGEHALSLLFECRLPGYPGWLWSVTMFRIDEHSEPTIAETHLLPGEKALTAPDWVPWAQRLAEYQAAQDANESDTGDDGDDDEDFDEDAYDEDPYEDDDSYDLDVDDGNGDGDDEEDGDDEGDDDEH